MRRLILILFVSITSFSFAQSEGAAQNETWETLFAKGKQYRERANSFRALECLERALELHDSDTIRRELAQTYFARGKFQKCIDLCRTVLYPDTLDADLYLLARSFEKMEQPDSAFMYQYMVADRNIENYNNLVSLAGSLIANEQAEEALELLDEYCKIDSTNLSVNTVKAYALHQAKRYKEAIVEYEKLKVEGDDRCSTNYYLGLSYYREHLIPDAYECLQRATEQSNRENTGILSRFGVVELARGRWDDGVADIEEAIEKMQPNKDMLFYLYNNIGNSFATHNRDRAIEYYNKAKEIYADRANIYYQLAYCYHQKKDYKREMQNYELYLKYAPKDEDPNTLEYARECIDECRKVLFMKGE